ncbi:MAG: DNA repair protein RecN [Clostridia bacterium]
MLSSLYIKNVAVIEEVSIDFSKGFTVLTGETGAGKSIVIDSISAILGERTSKDIIRTGTDKAVITALFSSVNQAVKDKLAEFEIETDDDELQIYREIRMSGKSVCKINGMPITATMLKELGVLLISIQGQHDSYELINTEIHGKYIDSYGKLDKLLKEYQAKYNKLKEIKTNLDKLTIDQVQKERRIDFLKFQIEEIEEAQIQIGERDLLLERRKIIKDSEDIARAIAVAKSSIVGEDDKDGILTMIDTATTELEYVSEFMRAVDSISKKLRDIEYNLQDITEELRALEDETDFSPNELEEVEERISLLYKLSLKYGESEEQILKVLEQSKQELQNIELSDENIEKLSVEFEKTKIEAINLAKELSKKRKEASIEFSKKVKNELSFLNMPNIEFLAQLERTSLYSNGCDKIMFLVSPNLGEQLKPMSKIASGGELSRIMLAIKTVLSHGDSVSTMIFDEIDAGISGDTANKVGKKLKEASENKQLICITHLAQMAAMADNHLFIEKITKENKTFTTVRALSFEEKKKELSRIIGGEEITAMIF